MYCLDTNIAIDIFRGDNTLKVKVAEVSARGDLAYITTITLCELYKGAYAIKSKQKMENELRVIKEFLQSNDLIALDESSCEEFGKVHFQLSIIGKPIPEPDLMIASIAKSHNLILVTRDKKHFENIDVKVEVW